MDFIDFDTFTKDPSSDWNLPQPQPALTIPISSNIENLSRKISKFKLTKILSSRNEPQESTNQENLMRDYAESSINFIANDEKNLNDVTVADSNQDKASALSTRLSRVLNNPMNDQDLKEIFNILQKELSHEDLPIKDLIDSGMEGSLTRQKFKTKIEHNLIQHQSHILKEYHPIIKQLRSIEHQLSNLNDLNSQIERKIEKHCTGSDKFKSKIKQLSNESTLILLKKSLLTSFQSKFTLSEYEEFILTNGELNEEFFATLQKAQDLNERCYVLLSIDNNQLGTKILNKSNQLINTSNDRIIHYCNKTLDNPISLNNKSRLTLLHQCFEYLSDKMNYYQTILNKFTESRSKLLLEEFYTNAETLSSIQDPVRYVGDLLAYVHSIALNEAETISTIFIADNKEDDESTVKKITNQILIKLTKPIKMKIDQIIFNEIKLSTILSIFNLLDLYTIMFQKQLKNNLGHLVEVLQSLIKECQNRLLHIISNRLSIIKQSNSSKLDLNLDLQPPNWIIDFYSDILAILDQTMTKTFLNLSKEENESFLKMIINEPVEIFNAHVEENKIFNKRDGLIIKFNFLDLILSKIIPISLLSDKIIELDSLNNEIVKEIVNLEFLNLLYQCDMENFYNVINMICPFDDEEVEVSIYEPIKENKLYTVDNLKKVDELTQKVLPNSMIEIQQSLVKLNSPMVANDIINKVFVNFVEFVRKFNSINEELLKVQFTWSEDDIKTLLGIES